MFLDLIKSALRNKVIWYLGSRYATFALQFITSIYIAVKLGVYYFGIWSFILLLVSIGSSCNWGIGNAAAILLVQHKEETDLCRRYTYNAGLLVLLTFILPLLILGYDRMIGIPLFAKYHLGNLIYAVAAIILLQYVCGFFTNIFRVKNKILEIMLQQTLWPVCMFCAIFCADGKELLYMLSVCYIIALFIPAVVYFHGKIVPFKGIPDKSIMKTIAGKGIFLFLYNVCFIFIMLTTKLQISFFYTVKEFGYFAFAFSLAQGVMLLLDSMLFLLFPKMIDMLKGDDTEKNLAGIAVLRKNYILPLHLLFYIILACCPLFFYFIPQYRNCLRPFVFILFTLLMYSHCFGYNSYLLAQNKEKQFSGIVFATLLLNNIFVYCLIVLKLQFEYIILGTLGAYTLYSVVVNSYALYCLGERKIAEFIKKNIPGTLLLPYAGILLLTVFAENCAIFYFLFLLLFVFVHVKKLKELFKNMLLLTRNDKLINI